MAVLLRPGWEGVWTETSTPRLGPLYGSRGGREDTRQLPRPGCGHFALAGAEGKIPSS